MAEPVGFLIVGLFAVGMAAAFLSADPESPTSRALAVLFGLLGITFLMNIAGYARFFSESDTLVIPCFSLLEIGILVAGFEWLLLMGRTAVPSDPAPRGEGTLRIAQGLACMYGLPGALFPRVRLQYWTVSWRPALFLRPQFYVFAVPLGLALALASIRVVQLLRAEIDPAERLRFVALALATPFWAAGGWVLPPAWKPVSFAIGEVIFLVGVIRYHIQQGQRGQFLLAELMQQLEAKVEERTSELRAAARKRASASRFVTTVVAWRLRC